jgi:hypothetical protein
MHNASWPNTFCKRSALNTFFYSTAQFNTTAQVAPIILYRTHQRGDPRAEGTEHKQKKIGGGIFYGIGLPLCYNTLPTVYR